MNKKWFYFLIPTVLILLFFLIIYKNDSKTYKGEVEIIVALPSSLLTDIEKDSLVNQLYDLYSGKSDNEYYSVKLILKAESDYYVEAPKSAITKTRIFFSNSFYTYENRKQDIETFLSNYKEFSEECRRHIDYTGDNFSKEAELIYYGLSEGNSENHVTSINALKSKIKDFIKSEKGNKLIICSSSLNSKEDRTSKKGEDIPESDDPVRKRKKNPDDPLGNEDDEPVQKLGETTITYSLENDVNVFRFNNSIEGVTFEYKITCQSGCTDGYNYSDSGSQTSSELYLDLKNSYESIKLRTFKIEVVTRLGKQSRKNSKSGIKLKCKK